MEVLEQHLCRLSTYPPIVYADMLAVLDTSPWKAPDHFLFYAGYPKKPMSHKKIDTDFPRSLKAVGIDEVQCRSLRNLHIGFDSLLYPASLFTPQNMLIRQH